MHDPLQRSSAHEPSCELIDLAGHAASQLADPARGGWLSRTILDQLPAALYVTDANGRLTYFNEAAATLSGRRPRIGSDEWCVIWRLYDLEGRPLAHADCPMAVALRENRSVRGVEAIGERPDGSRFRFRPHPTPLHDADGRLIGAFNLFFDVSEDRRSQAQVAFLASHDALTELPNRDGLRQQLSEAIEAARGRTDCFGLLVFDIAGLGEINAAFGPAAGDRALRETARRIGAEVRGMFVARTADDEFTVLAPGIRGSAELERLAGRIRSRIASHIRWEGDGFSVSASAGGTLFPAHGGSPDILVANAASALIQAKRNGPGTIVIFDAGAGEAARERQRLTADLRQAIDRGALSLFYQPQIKADGRVCAFEALVRWPHPARGMVMPDQFVPLAEENGLIIPMARWILDEACREAAGWEEPFVVSVNISPVQFREGGLVERIEAALKASGLPPERLELEITEGVMIQDFDEAMSILQRLGSLGVKVALDDFGTGYSSLSYLQAFPLNKLKIDRTFIVNLGERPQSAAIVRSVVELGHALGMTVAAEGVETQAQLEFLFREGCDIVQGYLTGRPLPIGRYDHVTRRTAAPCPDGARVRRLF